MASASTNQFMRMKEDEAGTDCTLSVPASISRKFVSVGLPVRPHAARPSTLHQSPHQTLVSIARKFENPIPLQPVSLESTEMRMVRMCSSLLPTTTTTKMRGDVSLNLRPSWSRLYAKIWTSTQPGSASASATTLAVPNFERGKAKPQTMNLNHSNTDSLAIVT